MNFRRNIYKELILWKKNEDRKPLMLLGARQVGKTHILEEFGKTYKKTYYFNLEENTEVRKIFDDGKSIEEIYKKIQVKVGGKIDRSNSLLILDEIQVSEKAVIMLKYFCENYRDLHVVCAGSLLGVSIYKEKYSIPVGKINTKYMYPMMFDEFLDATGNEFLREQLEETFVNKKVASDILHSKLLKLYQDYLCTGGMPGSIVEYVNKDMDLFDYDNEYIEEINDNYINDMSKYSNAATTLKCRAIYKSIPEQLSGDSSKFKYSIVEKGKQAKDFDSSIEWLIHSRIGIEVQRVKSGNKPLKAHVDNKMFKIYLSDVGLLRILSDVDIMDILDNDNFVFKGPMTENYVAVHLKSQFKDVYYYKDNKHEVDFIVKINNNIIPIEVKSGKNTRSTSLNKYIEKYDPKYAIRLSIKNFNFDNKLKIIPLYAAYLLKEM